MQKISQHLSEHLIVTVKSVVVCYIAGIYLVRQPVAWLPASQNIRKMLVVAAVLTQLAVAIAIAQDVGVEGDDILLSKFDNKSSTNGILNCWPTDSCSSSANELKVNNKLTTIHQFIRSSYLSDFRFVQVTKKSPRLYQKAINQFHLRLRDLATIIFS